MASKRNVKVDLGEIVDAMTMGLEGTSSYLDLETGEVLVVSELGDDLEDVCSRLEEDPERFEEIPRIPSSDSYAVMVDFVATVDEDDVKERLEIALEGKGAFGRFQGVISRYPDLRERWYAEKDRHESAAARRWLDDLGDQVSYAAPAPRPVQLPQPSPAPANIELLDLLVLGAQKTELMDGKVHRHVTAPTQAAADKLFRKLAREVCGYYGVEWRKRFVEGKRRFVLERVALEMDGTTIGLWLEVSRATWDAFC